ncbi:hypothetical protein [Sphingomonas pseudosanguinis]|uniref:Uncharacterized protein n=1 Tax=Sphingomonas pseudosanguinis TaxID=413712 RepID=A0A7W6A8I4_9SPHN|nr:hypothetical protein [Sphingomonas pseudosanguinis]MBB3877914.1 hypothetical protein [Sphingomonas pseudosanguinis]MBN3537787.1 hypothetical protein [Sphingomonas pseudosanguinis]
MAAEQSWLPGSFTKNYSWGSGIGLWHLYQAIRVGFQEELKPVKRKDFRARVAHLDRPDFIPLNYFLFNYTRDNKDYIAVDELVFQALTARHSPRFDHLALFAFNFGYAGHWRTIKPGQRYPTLWAKNYIIERVADVFRWNTKLVNADDIESFLRSKPQFKAKTSYRKVATNLAYLYRVGGLSALEAPRIERWWVDALFLALDRIVGDRMAYGLETSSDSLPSLLLRSNFSELSGPKSAEKTFAMAHLLSLYTICGKAGRFDPSQVQDRVSIELPDYYWQQPNNNAPQGAVHPTNPRILKTIPRECSSLAEKAGFRIVYEDDLETFNTKDFIATQTRRAVDSLVHDNIKSTLSPEELHKLTRGN